MHWVENSAHALTQETMIGAQKPDSVRIFEVLESKFSFTKMKFESRAVINNSDLYTSIYIEPAYFSVSRFKRLHIEEIRFRYHSFHWRRVFPAGDAMATKEMIGGPIPI